MDEDAPSFDEYIGPLKEQIDPYRLEDMVLAQDQTVHLECNWKAVFDNFGRALPCRTHSPSACLNL